MPIQEQCWHQHVLRCLLSDSRTRKSVLHLPTGFHRLSMCHQEAWFLRLCYWYAKISSATLICYVILRFSGILPGTAYSVSNRRYRHKTNPDTGSVYARHFATSGTDCIRLCQWTSGQCQSVNYGPINGIQVCELLSVVVTNGSIMQPWLVDAPGWTYTTVTGRAAAV